MAAQAVIMVILTGCSLSVQLMRRRVRGWVFGPLVQADRAAYDAAWAGLLRRCKVFAVHARLERFRSGRVIACAGGTRPEQFVDDERVVVGFAGCAFGGVQLRQAFAPLARLRGRLRSLQRFRDAFADRATLGERRLRDERSQHEAGGGD